MKKLSFLTGLATLTFLLLAPWNVSANLTVFDSVTGKFSVSVDGAGSNDASHLIDVLKPNASATVLRAYVAAASNGSYNIPDGDVTINGNPISWSQNYAQSYFRSVLADVTSIVKPVVDAAPAGITSFTFTEGNKGRIDGEILAVIFNDPTQPQRTIPLLFGGQALAGDTFSITLGQPIDPAASGSVADFGLGISFGYQGSSHGQHSVVKVNGTTISSWAGGQDDGAGANGALITVGGLGDSNGLPPEGTGPRKDDELYSLLSIISDTDTNISVFSQNPSNDDNIFFGYFVLSGAAVIGEGVILDPEHAVNPVNTSHTVTATVVDDNGDPIVGREVTFTVISGPHAGTTGTSTTDSNGNATFTYTGTMAGVDEIQASFVDSQNHTVTSNTVTKEWQDDGNLVELAEFTATATENGILVKWKTASEKDNLGFNLWRALKNKRGDYTEIKKLTEQLIPTEADDNSGASYSYEDSDVVPGNAYHYAVEDIDEKASSTFQLELADQAEATAGDAPIPGLVDAQ